MQRRRFLNTSLSLSAAVATLGTATQLVAADVAVPPNGMSVGIGNWREYCELRAYRMKPGASPALLEGYLENAFIPALAARNVNHVGVFTEVEIDKKAFTSQPKADAPLWVLVPHASLESFVSVSADLNANPKLQEAGAEYLNVPKASPAFDRVDTWLYRAFAGMTRLELPSFSQDKVATRVFEMRDYESHGERAALNKMAMFNNGEIPLMKELGMSPVFFGQGIAGPNLPHLRYITGGTELESHLKNWTKFGPSPVWKKLSTDPQYKDNTSKNTARFLVPTSYSRI